MNEEKYDLGDGSGMKFEKGKLGKWFENFWYHYKWHTLITLFVIAVIAICTVQMCSKVEYDVYIMYAGSADVRGKRNENDLSDYETLCKSINEAVEDFDENGEVKASLETLYMLSSQEKAEIEKELADMKANGEGSYELNYVQLNENETTFRDRITFSDYYVFLISESVYNAYQMSENGVMLFTSIRYLANEERGVRFYDDSAVYLNSTEFGKLPGLCDLPEDTLITLRSREALSTHFNKDVADMHFRNAETVVKNMLNYGK